MDIRSSIIYTVNHQIDVDEYRANPLINKSSVNMFYGLDKTEYPSYVMQIINRTKNGYKEAVNSVSMYVSDVLAE